MKRETRQKQELQLTSATALDDINRRFKQLNKQLYQLHNSSNRFTSFTTQQTALPASQLNKELYQLHNSTNSFTSFTTQQTALPASRFTNHTIFLSVRCLQKILLRMNRGLDYDVLLFRLMLPLWRSVLALVGLLTLDL